jgi:hypothetical protein
LTTEFAAPMAESLAVRFGDIICEFFVPPIGSSESSKQEYIFVLDCSGSMSGYRIAQANECLKLILHSLPSAGYFNLARFGSRCDPMWQSSGSSSGVVTDENIGRSLTYLESIDANLGGTEMTKALERPGENSRS